MELKQVIGGGESQLADFYDLIKKAQAYDDAHGEPQCESPEKAEWIEALKSKLSKLEERINKLEHNR